jgi:hypothetical protein
MSKRLVGTGLAIGLVAGAGAGLILEMSGSAGAASGTPAVEVVVDDSTTDAAEPVRPDASARLQEILKSLVDDGTITQEQADKVVAALVAAGPVRGPGGHRGFGGHGLIGITQEELRTAVQGGQTIAEIAVSNGKTAQDVIDAIVAEATTRINTAVTDGKLTQAEADERLAELTTAVTEFVNNTPSGGRGFGLPGFGGRHRGDDNAADDTTDDTTADTTVDASVTTVAG